ncbi:MAG: hypothetical protein Q7T56_19545 [Nocardioidaceae bacterium]|nr:hypothetical protein [Nocardioidaceae bacterium]
MMVLLWLAVPIGVAVLAMVWAAWSGRRRRREPSRDAAHARFSAAVTRPLPARARTVVAQRPERPTGIAVRPSQHRTRS